MARIKYWSEETKNWEYADISNETSSSDGKSAYEYAQEAGYTGSEEEFAVKLAEETPKAFYVNVTDNGDGSGTMDKTYDELMAANAAGCPIIAMLNASDGASIHGGTLLTVDKDFIIGTVISQIDMKSIVMVVISSDIVMMQVMQLVPDTLPNPNALVINDKEYDGSEAVSIDTTVYEFNVTVNEDGTKVLDKTYDDVLAAHESGRAVICKLNIYGSSFRLPLLMADNGLLGFIAMPAPAFYVGCILTSDGAVEIMDSQSNITINDQIWDGDVPVDFTDTINNMIDEKVPTKLSDLKNDLISGASVGQTVKITAVDDNGVPTAWEAVDMASGGDETLELIVDLTTTEEVDSIQISKDSDGNSFSVRDAEFLVNIPVAAAKDDVVFNFAFSSIGGARLTTSMAATTSIATHGKLLSTRVLTLEKNTPCVLYASNSVGYWALGNTSCTAADKFFVKPVTSGNKLPVGTRVRLWGVRV